MQIFQKYQNRDSPIIHLLTNTGKQKQTHKPHCVLGRENVYNILVHKLGTYSREILVEHVNPLAFHDDDENEDANVDDDGDDDGANDVLQRRHYGHALLQRRQIRHAQHRLMPLHDVPERPPKARQQIHSHDDPYAFLQHNQTKLYYNFFLFNLIFFFSD